MDRNPPIVLFVGPSGSGKTMLVEKLIARLRKEEIKVGAIKRSHHDLELDTPGKDSYRFGEAGANPILLAGDDLVAFIERPFGAITLATLVKFFTNKADIILVEGFKDEPLKGFENFRFFFGPPFPKPEDKTGFIITGGGQEHVPGKVVFRREQVESIAAFIMRWLAAR
jgi:molybdopterin-guanine dinucleotide biosynthesis protein MobB